MNIIPLSGINLKTMGSLLILVHFKFRPHVISLSFPFFTVASGYLIKGLDLLLDFYKAACDDVYC